MDRYPTWKMPFYTFVPINNNQKGKQKTEYKIETLLSSIFFFNNITKCSCLSTERAVMLLADYFLSLSLLDIFIKDKEMSDEL